MPKKVNDAKLLEALLINGGVSGAAETLNISRNAIYKRLQNPQFRALFDTAQGAVLSAAATAMAGALEDAVGALVDVLRSKETTPAVRVQAAGALLSHCGRYVESASVLRRLDALEETQKFNF